MEGKYSHDGEKNLKICVVGRASHFRESRKFKWCEMGSCAGQ